MSKKKYQKILTLLLFIFLTFILTSCIRLIPFVRNTNISNNQIVRLQNKISEEHIKTLVKIKAQRSNLQQIGSGVFIDYKYENGSLKVYVLTNAHVVLFNNINYRNTIYSIETSNQLEGNYEKGYNSSIFGYYYNKGNVKLIDYDINLDLALLQLTINEEDLNDSKIKTIISSIKIINMAEKNEKEGNLVIALGSPESQANTVTYGYIKSYQAVEVDGVRKSFLAMNHTAPGTHGSSGGPVLNSKLELVGINFAGTENLENKHAFSKDMSAIPIEEVHKFLNVAMEKANKN